MDIAESLLHTESVVPVDDCELELLFELFSRSISWSVGQTGDSSAVVSDGVGLEIFSKIGKRADFAMRKESG